MKNQYIGDINDYRKYGLLRALIDDPIFRVGVFWMLTENDSRNDGQIRKYINNPKKWRQFDPPLFDSLSEIIRKNPELTVSHIESSGILPGTIFADNLIPDDAKSRETIFSSALNEFSGIELVFFDPDNGLEVKSKPKGRKDSNKYLYFEEVKQAFENGHSLLIYQHFPHEKHDEYIDHRVTQLKQITNAATIFSIAAGSVCYFAVPQSGHLQFIKDRMETISSRWGREFIIRIHN